MSFIARYKGETPCYIGKQEAAAFRSGYFFVTFEFADAQKFATVEAAKKAAEIRSKDEEWEIYELTYGLVWCDSRGEKWAGTRYFSGRDGKYPMWTASRKASKTSRFATLEDARADRDRTHSWRYQNRRDDISYGVKVARFLKRVA